MISNTHTHIADVTSACKCETGKNVEFFASVIRAHEFKKWGIFSKIGRGIFDQLQFNMIEWVFLGGFTLHLNDSQSNWASILESISIYWNRTCFNLQYARQKYKRFIEATNNHAWSRHVLIAALIKRIENPSSVN